jgi:hypothetical protein
MKEVNYSPAAVTARLRRVGDLWRICRALKPVSKSAPKLAVITAAKPPVAIKN